LCKTTTSGGESAISAYQTGRSGVPTAGNTSQNAGKIQVLKIHKITQQSDFMYFKTTEYKLSYMKRMLIICKLFGKYLYKEMSGK